MDFLSPTACLNKCSEEYLSHSQTINLHSSPESLQSPLKRNKILSGRLTQILHFITILTPPHHHPPSRTYEIKQQRSIHRTRNQEFMKQPANNNNTTMRLSLRCSFVNVLPSAQRLLSTYTRALQVNDFPPQSRLLVSIARAIARKVPHVPPLLSSTLCVLYVLFSQLTISPSIYRGGWNHMSIHPSIRPVLSFFLATNNYHRLVRTFPIL